PSASSVPGQPPASHRDPPAAERDRAAHVRERRRGSGGAAPHAGLAQAPALVKSDSSAPSAGRRTPRDELAEETAHGELYLTQLRRAQLELSLRGLVAVGGLVVSLRVRFV